MARTIDSATKTALILPTIYPIWLIRLDFAGDPVYINTGMSNLFFASGMGYDAALVGFTFSGAGNVLSIDTVTDAADGSQSLTLSLPGVNMSSDYLHQIINNGDLWQKNQGFVWLALTDDTGALIGLPTRVKTARMDQIVIAIDPDNQTGTLSLTLESQANYNSETNQHRYNQQPQIDSTDVSQQWIYALANLVAEIGIANTRAVTSSAAAVSLTTKLSNAISGLK